MHEFFTDPRERNYFQRMATLAAPQSFLEGFMKGLIYAGMPVLLLKVVADLSPSKCLLFALGSACFGAAWGVRNQPARQHISVAESVLTPLAPQTAIEGAGKGLLLGLVLFWSVVLNMKKFSPDIRPEILLGTVTAVGVLAALGGAWGHRNNRR
ncbi:MAG TPA: hypothetical protein VGV92_05100 [Gammaproteobacteria bacterium]|nr:hypothetical protein [Gammaproteobacteria bacterium]